MPFKNTLSNISIKYKIILFIYLLIFLITNILSFIFYSTSRDYILNKVSSANLNIVKQHNASINNLQMDLYNLSTYIATNHEIISFLHSNNRMDENNIASLTDINLKNSIMNLVVSKEYISFLALYREGLDLSPFYICTDLSGNLSTYSAIQENAIYQNIILRNGAPFWFLNEKESNYIFQNNKNKKIVLGRMIKSPNDYSPLGTLFLGFNENVLRRIYIDNISSENESIVILDENNAILSSSGNIPICENSYTEKNFYKESTLHKNGYIIERIGEKDMLIAYSSDNLYNWKIFYSVDTSSLTEELQNNRAFIFAVAFLCMLFSLPLILLITHYITTPIHNLLNSMKKVKSGNFTEQVSITTNDEIGQLTVVYNEMIFEIKKLIEENYILEIKEREAELNTLHSQINPHFLYNTLDTIYWKAQANKQTDIGKMVYSLSKLFRLSLNRGDNFITVAKEKELLENYLLLQKVRFKDKLNYTISIDDNLLHYEIPKFILQPFIENAIVHGIEPKENSGSIELKGNHLDNHLHFVLTDNGVGMDEVKLTSLLESIHIEQTKLNEVGFAIHNINERLNLHFKEDYSLNITSKKHHGTTIEILLPKIN